MRRHEDEYVEAFYGTASPPPRRRPSPGMVLGRALIGLIVISGLVGTVLLAGPALDVENQPPSQGPEAVENP